VSYEIARADSRHLTEGGTGVQRVAPVLRAITLDLNLDTAASVLHIRGCFASGVAGGWKIRLAPVPFEELGLVRVALFGYAALSAERFAWRQPFDIRASLPSVRNPHVPYDIVVWTLKGSVLARIPWSPLT
jgi:hypothetical protein